MPEHCKHCGQRYFLEPAFYSGAMYVSYALQVAMFTAVYVALRVLFDPAMEVYMACMIGASVILFPVTLRVSRAIYINFFVSYQKPEERNQLNNYHTHTNKTTVSQTLHGNIHE